ncbi:MAG TPA: hypothetical protein PKD12_12300 [Nitrospira sp.]|nr:hypothetical protein [Nitrospira sp.]
MITSALVACGMGIAEHTVMRNDQNQSKITGKTLLIGDKPETPNYGLYSYVLFESPPTAATKPIYLAIISACLKEVPDLDKLEQTYPDRKMLNAMFIPVKVFPFEQTEHNSVTGDSTNSQVPQPEHVQLRARAEQILEQYNYDRAREILRKLSNVQKNGGPYLASSLVPVSSGNGTSSFLFQDLSVIRSVSSQDEQTEMAFQWVLDFVNRISNPRSIAWGRPLLDQFLNKTLDSMQVALTHRGVPVTQPQLKEYVSLSDIVFQPEDNSSKRTFLFPQGNLAGNGTLAFGIDRFSYRD